MPVGGRSLERQASSYTANFLLEFDNDPKFGSSRFGECLLGYGPLVVIERSPRRPPDLDFEAWDN